MHTLILAASLLLATPAAAQYWEYLPPEPNVPPHTGSGWLQESDDLHRERAQQRQQRRQQVDFCRERYVRFGYQPHEAVRLCPPY